jgi:hypothetical protein
VDGTVVASENVTLSADEDVNINAGEDVVAVDDEVRLIADADGDGDGEIFQAESEDEGGGTIIAFRLVAYAAEGIELPEVQVTQVQATNDSPDGAEGDIAIVNDGDLWFVDEDGLGWSVRNTGGDVFVTVGSTMFLASLIESVDGDVFLTAFGGEESEDGSMFDENDVDGREVDNIRAGGDAELFATGVIGTLANCVEVEIGDELRVTAAGNLDGFMFHLCGTTGDGNITIVPTEFGLEEDEDYPGVGLFNGLEIGTKLMRARNFINEYEDERKRWMSDTILDQKDIWHEDGVLKDERP